MAVEKKIYKVSEQTLIMTGGNILYGSNNKKLPEIVQDEARQQGITDPEGIAKIVRKWVECAPQEATLLNYSVMGFDDSGSLKRIHFTHDCRNGKQKPINPGNIGVMAHECDELARKMFVRVFNKKFKGGWGMPLLRAAKRGWTETIRYYEKDYLFGGEIFMEVVTPGNEKA